MFSVQRTIIGHYYTKIKKEVSTFTVWIGGYYSIVNTNTCTLSLVKIY